MHLLAHFPGHTGQTSPPHPVDKAFNPESPHRGFSGQAKIDSSKVRLIHLHIRWCSYYFKHTVYWQHNVTVSAANTDQEGNSHLSRTEASLQHQTGIWHFTQPRDNAQLSAYHKGTADKYVLEGGGRWINNLHWCILDFKCATLGCVNKVTLSNPHPRSAGTDQQSHHAAENRRVHRQDAAGESSAARGDSETQRGDPAAQLCHQVRALTHTVVTFPPRQGHQLPWLFLSVYAVHASSSYQPLVCPSHGNALTTWGRGSESTSKHKLCKTGSSGSYPYVSVNHLFQSTQMN